MLLAGIQKKDWIGTYLRHGKKTLLLRVESGASKLVVTADAYRKLTENPFMFSFSFVSLRALRGS